METHQMNRTARRRPFEIETLETRLLFTAGELIANGGFETGSTGWTASASWQAGLSSTSFTTYHGGSRYAFYGTSTGATVNNSSGSLFQEIAIPAGYVAPTLTFWSRTSTSETTTTLQNDKMVVTVQPAGGGTPIQTLVTISNLDGLGVTGGPFTDTGKYTPYEFALPASLAGQTVRINFAVTTNSSLGTTFRIDDIGVSEPVPVTPGTSGQVVGYIRDGKSAFFDQLELSHMTWTNYFSLTASTSGGLSGTLSHLDNFAADAHALGIGVSITIVGSGSPVSFAALAASATARQTFATNIKNYLLAHNLDGVDIDWEPKPDGVQAYNFGLLIDALYEQLHPIGKKITAATFPNGRKDLPVAATKLMDWVNVMCYNFQYDNHATLADTIDGMNTWLNYGVAKDKLVMGVPFYGSYGTSWSDRTTITYGAAIEEYKTLYGAYPAPSVDSYVNGAGKTVYISGVTTTAAKMQHIRDLDYAGAMMWEPTQDHFDPITAAYTPYSLLPILGDMVHYPDPPSTPDLATTSDNGSSSTDNLTNDNTPTFTGTAPSSSTVKLYAGGALLGETTASGAGAWTFTAGAMGDGVHAITATATTENGPSPLSGALNVTIDTSAPTADVINVSPDPRQSSVSSVSVSFTQAVTGFTFADLSLTRDGNSVALNVSNNPTSGDGGLTWTISNFSSPTSASGQYALTVNAAGVTDLAGNALSANAADAWATFPTWLSLSSVANWNGTSKVLNVSGAATITADPVADNPTINASGAEAVLTINPSSGLAIRINALSLTGGATATVTSLGAARTPGNHRVLRVQGGLPTIDANSTLDLTDNDLIVDYAGTSPITQVEAMVRSGYNVTGDWLGKRITSSAAATDASFTLGVADNAQVAAPFGTAQGGPLFAGQDVDLTTVLVKFTHRVDLNLDGLVTDADAITFSTNHEFGAPAYWAIGDLNMDGIFSDDDSILFGTYYDSTLPQL
jgi:GH18 family chitinase